MELESIKSFIKIAETNNMTLAAEELNMSPSALSSALQKLEKELGYSLFDRSVKGMKLTANGKYFLEWAKKNESFRDRLIADINRSAHDKGRIRIGTMINSDTLYIMLSAFLERYPGIQIELYDEKAILDNYLMSELDAFLIPKEDMQGQPGIKMAQRTSLLVMMNDKNPLASREHLTLDDLKDTGFVFTAHNGRLDWTYDYCTSHGFDPDVRFVCEEFDDKLDLIAHSDAVAIGYNTMRLLRAQMRKIKAIPLLTEEKVNMEFWFVWRKKPLNPLMDRLSAFALEFDRKGRDYFSRN
ncbi:MAG: LysR family transcriptional regulator [Erysipelotrichaceae bacterium]|nr:LysR family transcriptional regulator [Erysipelotrichaceae bacterium]